MPRYKLTIEYDGTPFAGWQRQENARSVQQTLEEAFQSYAQEEVSLVCAGRTDAGVHARGQVAHIDLSEARKPFSIMQGIHHHLKKAPISIVNAEEVSDDFSARFDATSRRYLYRIFHRTAQPVLEAKRVWHVYHDMDLDKMRKAAEMLVGKHDFTSFRAAACQAKSPVKTLDRLEIEQVGEEIHIHAEAKSFLHHQVRNLTGALTYVATGKWQLEDVQKALEAKDRQAGPITAPAHGLYFMEVKY